jgi:hypothetical protein
VKNVPDAFFLRFSLVIPQKIPPIIDSNEEQDFERHNAGGADELKFEDAPRPKPGVFALLR